MKTWLRASMIGCWAALWLRPDWGPREAPTWQQAYIPLLLAVVGLFVYWWFLSWLTRRRLTSTGWRATRILWPSAAVALLGLTALAGAMHLRDPLLEILAAAAAIMNLPLILLLYVVSQALDDIPWWIVLPVVTIGAWIFWWAVVIFFEGRARDTGMVRLDI